MATMTYSETETHIVRLGGGGGRNPYEEEVWKHKSRLPAQNPQLGRLLQTWPLVYLQIHTFFQSYRELFKGE